MSLNPTQMAKVYTAVYNAMTKDFITQVIRVTMPIPTFCIKIPYGPIEWMYSFKRHSLDCFIAALADLGRHFFKKFSSPSSDFTCSLSCNWAAPQERVLLRACCRILLRHGFILWFWIWCGCRPFSTCMTHPGQKTNRQRKCCRALQTGGVKLRKRRTEKCRTKVDLTPQNSPN